MYNSTTDRNVKTIDRRYSLLSISETGFSDIAIILSINYLTVPVLPYPLELFSCREDLSQNSTVSIEVLNLFSEGGCSRI